MIKGMEAVLLGSQNAKKLAEFYRVVVGLKQRMVFEMGDKNEEGFDFDLGGTSLYIMSHSDVKGKSKTPARIMFNLEVDDLEKEVARLKKSGVKPVAEIYHVEDYGYIATFADVDGNYFQLVKTKE